MSGRADDVLFRAGFFADTQGRGPGSGRRNDADCRPVRGSGRSSRVPGGEYPDVTSEAPDGWTTWRPHTTAASGSGPRQGSSSPVGGYPPKGSLAARAGPDRSRCALRPTSLISRSNDGSLLRETRVHMSVTKAVFGAPLSVGPAWVESCNRPPLPPTLCRILRLGCWLRCGPSRKPGGPQRCGRWSSQPTGSLFTRSLTRRARTRASNPPKPWPGRDPRLLMSSASPRSPRCCR